MKQSKFDIKKAVEAAELTDDSRLRGGSMLVACSECIHSHFEVCQQRSKQVSRGIAMAIRMRDSSERTYAEVAALGLGASVLLCHGAVAGRGIVKANEWPVSQQATLRRMEHGWLATGESSDLVS